MMMMIRPITEQLAVTALSGSTVFLHCYSSLVLYLQPGLEKI